MPPVSEERRTKLTFLSRVRYLISKGIYIIPPLIFILDQMLKFFFYQKNIIEEKTPLIKGLFYIIPPLENPGIAFGLFKNYGNFFIIPIILIIFFTLFIYFRTSKKEVFLKGGLLFIFCGGLSNLIDRLVYGGVIDYLLLKYFPYAFNLADPSILIGVGMIVTKVLQERAR